MSGQSPDDDLDVGDSTIPSAELEWRFTTSGGPGGQHANRSNTRAELVFDLSASDAFPAAIRDRMVAKLGNQITVSVAESRSQFRNRMLARARLREMLLEAQKQPRRRKPTKPTTASRRRRLDEKRAHGEKKRLRRDPKID